MKGIRTIPTGPSFHEWAAKYRAAAMLLDAQYTPLSHLFYFTKGGRRWLDADTLEPVTEAQAEQRMHDTYSRLAYEKEMNDDERS